MRIHLVLIASLLLILLIAPQTVSATTIVVSNVTPAIGATGVNTNVTISVRINSSNGSIPAWQIECSNGQSRSGTNGTNGTYFLNLTNLQYNTRYWCNVHIGAENHAYYFNTKTQSGGGSGNSSGEEKFTGEITIFPDSPLSGNTFAVILGKRIDTGGYVYASGKLYPLTIINGFGTILLDDSTYGDAYVWLYGANSSTFIKKTFTVQFGMVGSLTLEVPETIQVNDVLPITVNVGGKPVNNVPVNVTDPTGVDLHLRTGADGKISQVVDKVGLWLVRCSFANQNVVKQTTIKYRELTITTEKTSYILGDDVRISTDANTVVNIIKDGVIKLQSTALNGALVFTPNEAGTYQAQGTIGNKQGTANFDVSQSVEVQMFDLNNMRVTTASVGQRYMVKVVDFRNRAISDYDSVTYGYGQTIPLNGGIGFWTPTANGEQTLSLEDKTGFQSQNLLVTIIGGSSGGFSLGNIDQNILIGVAVAIIIIIAILYIMRNRLPTGFKKIFSGFKPKREVPI